MNDTIELLVKSMKENGKIKLISCDSNSGKWIVTFNNGKKSNPLLSKHLIVYLENN